MDKANVSYNEIMRENYRNETLENNLFLALLIKITFMEFKKSVSFLMTVFANQCKNIKMNTNKESYHL